MTVSGLTGVLTCGVTGKEYERRAIEKVQRASGFCHYPYLNGIIKRRFVFSDASKNWRFTENQCASNYGFSASDTEKSDLIGIPDIDQLHRQSIQSEFIMLSLPAMAGQAIEPLAQLMETAYIGRIGPMELASAAVSISIFNIISKVFNIPLLSVVTSFVAEDISRNESMEVVSDGGCQQETIRVFPHNEMDERKVLPSVCTALVLSITIGILEAAALYFGSGLFLSMMGISLASPMRIPAQQFLAIRAFGAPAVVLSMAIQGIFRGFKDTKTPVFCLGLGNLSAVFLFPILMYHFCLGMTGAAISTIASQYIVTFLMIWHLNKRTILSLPDVKTLHFGAYLKSGGFLLGRTLASVMTITLSMSMAARLGPFAMAAHQICLQVWLSASLLADAQAAAGQALIARSVARGDFSTVKEISYFALKAGLFTGISLALVLGVTFGSLATLFTNNAEVLDIIRPGTLFVSASQPFNAMAYIFDGLHYGVSDFSFAAWSMMVVGAIASAILLYAPSVVGLPGVWLGLTVFMGLRIIAGYLRLLSKKGPWWFLQEDIQAN